MTNMSSDLARARGTGPAHTGVMHWWMQRVSAIALIFLSIWFIYSIATVAATGTINDFATYLGKPLNAIAIILFVVVSIYHGTLGLQVVIEDYVHCKYSKFTMLILIKFISVVSAFAAILSVIYLHFIFLWHN